jgi:hypothetical protein
MATLMLGCCTLFVVSCSSDDQDPEPEPEQKQEQGDLLQLVSCTRSNAYEESITDKSKIQMFITSAEEETKQATFVWNNPSWSKDGKITERVNYYLYGVLYGDIITPSGDIITPNISLSDYSSSGATLAVSNLSPLALEGQDPCVIVGVKGTTTNVHYGENDVQRGKFKYEGQAKGQNYVHLLLDRLYSAVTFDFGPLDSEYASLRTIKLTKLELKVNSSAWSNLNLSIQLKANDDRSNPVETITATQSGTTDLNPIILFESADGKEFSEILESDIKVCCFEPSVARYLSIVSYYDVYDKGDPSRNIEPYKLSSRTAVNALGSILTDTNTHLPILTRGEKLTLTLTVNPTYLYQLSDPDATIVTIKNRK